MRKNLVAILAGGCYTVFMALGCLTLALLMAPPMHTLLATATTGEVKEMAMWGMGMFAFCHFLLRGLIRGQRRSSISLGVFLVVFVPTVGWVFIPHAPLETICTLLIISFAFSYHAFLVVTTVPEKT